MKKLAVVVVLPIALASCATRATSAPDTTSRAARAAIADLARTSGAPQEEITVVSETDATWNDACLGCPEKGEMCAPVVTPGSRIVLLARGVTSEYHADHSGGVRRCP